MKYRGEAVSDPVCCEKKVVSGDDKEFQSWKMQGGMFVGSLQIERQVRECLSVLCSPFSLPPFSQSWKIAESGVIISCSLSPVSVRAEA